MEYRELSADDKAVMGKVHLFLNGEDVSNRAMRALVPTDPGIEAWGEVSLYKQWPPILDEDNGLPTEQKTGIVSWEWK
jgi:squalene cyclase